MTTAWSRHENGSAVPFTRPTFSEPTFTEPNLTGPNLTGPTRASAPDELTGTHELSALDDGGARLGEHQAGDHRCSSCGQPVGYWAVDRMTGLYDRWGWDDEALRVVRHAERRREPLALLMLDLDYFKQVNDRFGHLAGDTMLRSVADVMRAATAEEDVLGRYGGRGGDEFLALMPTTNRDRALAVANRIRENVRSAMVTVPDAASGVRATLAGQTVSIGVALHVPARGAAAGLNDLLLDADAALLLAKREGRDRVRVLSRPQRDRAQRDRAQRDRPQNAG